MTLSAPVQFGILGGVVVVGLVIAKYTRVDGKLRALPLWLQCLVGGVAASPLFVLDERVVLEGVLDPFVVAIIVSLTLWMVLPLLFYRAVAPEPPRRNETC